MASRSSKENPLYAKMLALLPTSEADAVLPDFIARKLGIKLSSIICVMAEAHQRGHFQRRLKTVKVGNGCCKPRWHYWKEAEVD